MSEALFKYGGLRFWSENQIQMREMIIDRMQLAIRETLSGINPAWRFIRCEGPPLHPRSQISDSYDDNDIFITNDKRGGEDICLRAETTPSSYAYARHIRGKMPLCVWQSGYSFRREKNDGASAGKLRFNAFQQLEFQCIYRANTRADYRAALLPIVESEISRFTGVITRQAPSDRLPSYSESTIDIEAVHKSKNQWREMASCSIRTDFADDMRVCEIAIGLDRVVTLATEEMPIGL